MNFSEEHKIQMLKKFKQFMEKKQFCDLDLIAAIDGKKISVHRIILTAANPHFSEVLAAEEADANELCLFGVNGKTLKILVEYCYSGEYEIGVDNVINLLAAASRYRFEEIEMDCLSFLERSIQMN